MCATQQLRTADQPLALGVLKGVPQNSNFLGYRICFSCLLILRQILNQKRTNLLGWRRLQRNRASQEHCNISSNFTGDPILGKVWISLLATASESRTYKVYKSAIRALLLDSFAQY
jgi:hypothetical protein